VTKTARLEVTVDCDENCFDLPEWKELLSRDPTWHIFATPEWNKLWWEEFRAGKDLFLVTMKREGDVAAIIPLYRKEEKGRRVLRFIGGIDLTDYLGPICSLEDRNEVAEALTEWLETTDVWWDELDAHSMPVPLGFAEFLVDHADRRGFAFTLDQEEVSAILPLAGGWDTYLATLGSKERHELRRKLRRLGREFPETSVRTSTEETLERDLEIFFDMHRGAEGDKGSFMRPHIATFFERVARAFMPLGWLRLDFLEAGGRALASAFGFEVANRFYLYNSAFTDDARDLSPGVVLAAELVKRALARGLQYFDFLRGPERYKYQFGAQAVPLHNVRVINKHST
jgi:CelD/BcsL family acetyltransferase involved in cellulose biosynthesis